MTLNFYNDVFDFLNREKEVRDLKKRKLELGQKIKEKNNQKPDFSDSYNFIGVKEVEKEEVETLKDSFENCAEILRCSIKNECIVEDWGWILQGGTKDESEDIEDNNEEYYAFIDQEYNFYYLMYSNNENITVVAKKLWKEYIPKLKYGEFPPCDEEDCWFKENEDRLNEWYASYILPDICEEEGITLCEVCLENNCMESTICRYEEKLKKAYKSHKKIWKKKNTKKK